jgi:hypothetical protein
LASIALRSVSSVACTKSFGADARAALANEESAGGQSH